MTIIENEYVKTSHKPVQTYYTDLERYAKQDAKHEGAVSAAFHRLLDDTAKRRNWTLIAQKSIPGTKGKTIRPDGVLQNDFQIERGYWEAKDSDDNLDVEINNKIDDGYPLTNIIFEDTQRAVLFQDDQEILRVSMDDRDGLVRLLNLFYNYSPPAIQQFERAVEQFQEKIPQLATGLAGKIKQARTQDKSFREAFNTLHEVLKEALNPNLSADAVQEMLIQHLLTERLFRTIFDNPDFVRRNVIARELEKVIDKLTDPYFNRAEFLGDLDQFYAAIEAAASEQRDFSQKQAFLNQVYERFFQGYSVKQADTHGIVYTPQEIVDFMCASVARVLQDEFGRDLGHEQVQILDPATGTGNFIVNLLRRVPKQHLATVYAERLFANEVMLLPYYIASLNIERQYHELTGRYQPFEGLCFTDTLDLEARQLSLGLFSEENMARVARERSAPITVIIGNPPYNVGQLDENDNNKNRAYPELERRIRQTYATDSKASNLNSLYDAYVKFFRWAVDRLGDRDGIVCFVSNNGFLSGIAFDGFRKHMAQDFDTIYHFDFKGNARTSGERRKQEGGNIFDDQIRVGIGITLLIKKKSQEKTKIFYHAVGDYWDSEKKREYLRDFESVADVEWETITPDKRHTWIIPDNAAEFSHFVPIGGKEAKRASRGEAETIFKTYGRGVATSRDAVVYDFDRETLKKRVRQFIEDYNAEVDRYRRQGKDMSMREIDDFVDPDKVKWSRDLKQDLKRGKYAEFDEAKIRRSLYRPFTKEWLFFDRILNEEVYVFPSIFPTPATEQENRVICITDIGTRADKTSALITNHIADLHLCASTDSHQCFAFYTYDEDGNNRRENITDWALQQFRTEYDDPSITKWDIFYYVYGLLHHPAYGERYEDSLKRDLPRLPFAPDFRAFAQAGRQLAELHLGYEDIDPYDLTWRWKEDAQIDYTVEKMRFRQKKTAIQVNEVLTLAGIPPQAHEYRLGNRSALEWVVDRYRVKEDWRTGITWNPNDHDNPRYIVDLIGKVTAVSVQTVEIINGLPDFR